VFNDIVFILVQALRHPEFEQRLNLLTKAPDMPEWWKPGDFDKWLFRLIPKHGLCRWTAVC
jgi:hypothetical protein